MGTVQVAFEVMLWGGATGRGPDRKISSAHDR